jgi:hypothetical protein
MGSHARPVRLLRMGRLMEGMGDDHSSRGSKGSRRECAYDVQPGRAKRPDPLCAVQRKMCQVQSGRLSRI